MRKLGVFLVFLLVLVLSIQSIVAHDQEEVQDTPAFTDATGQSQSNSDGNVEEAAGPELAQETASSPTRSFARPFGPEPDQGPKNSGSEMAAAEGEAQPQEEQNAAEYKDATGQSPSNSDGNVEEGTARALASSPTRSFARPFGPESPGPEMATDGGESAPANSEMAHEQAETDAEKTPADDTQDVKEN